MGLIPYFFAPFLFFIVMECHRIVVIYFWVVDHAIVASKLVQRVLDRVVSHHIQPGTVVPLMVLQRNLSDEFCVPRPLKPNIVANFPPSRQPVIQAMMDRIRLPVRKVCGDVSGVGHPNLWISLIHSTKEPKDLVADVSIISIQHHLNIIVFAELMRSVDDVVSSIVSLQVLDISDPISREIGFLQILFRLLKCPVIRIVVEENNVIVGVLLLQNRKHGPLVTVLFDVVQTGHRDAKRDLKFFIFLYTVLFVIVVVLSLCQRVVLRQVQ